ncbi:scarecrow-like protein 8 [Lycium barbarum]|uniref:scarecrow-like protein 8 n=1 Tax=Lycium barbarum TaxID=112863 RepID=UPI00293E2149|nr:scarecrow-like protein 8 [Lycium barbarum]
MALASHHHQHVFQHASLSPSSSTSSCASSTESPLITCPKQSIIEAATAISEGKNDVAVEILTRLSQVGNVRGSSDQRLTAYMVSALRSRVNPTDYPPPVMELHSREHTDTITQNLYEVSPCFKLGFMAANLAILEVVADHNKLHVIDFDIGQGGQYVHLLHALAAKKSDKPTILKITAFTEQISGVDERINSIGLGLKSTANTVGVCLYFTVMACKVTELTREKLGVEPNEALAVNFAFKLYRLPDESVTTDNLRSELLRRVKGLSPNVVTVVEQEMNGNTAPFLARVNEACGHYGALFDSLDATVSRDNTERVRIEEGLSRKMANSVACEGRDRVERCEVFGKWRARMSMAGFGPRPVGELVANSPRSKLNSGTRGNPGFTVNEQSGGICFGWMGRTLTVASAWR